MASVPYLSDALAQLRADHRRLSAELRAAQPGTDAYGRLAAQLVNVGRTIKATEDRLRGGGQPTLL